jgi:2-C-methyl-D-erythritol 4-phosphate cytidylyltransferase
MNRTVIIVAGGKGVRMGGALPKQFLPLHGKPVLMHTLEVFHRWDAAAGLWLVLPEEGRAYWEMLCREMPCVVPHRIVRGGETRFHSVRNGLEEVGKEAGLIAIHDGVRPFVAPHVIASCFATAEACGAAIPVIPLTESVRELDGVRADGTLCEATATAAAAATGSGRSRPLDRNRLCIVQTPQVFRAELLHEAYARPCRERFTDDASVVEAAGHPICLVDGNRENIKLTAPVDLLYAEILLSRRQPASPPA